MASNQQLRHQVKPGYNPFTTNPSPNSSHGQHSQKSSASSNKYEKSGPSNPSSMLHSSRISRCSPPSDQIQYCSSIFFRRRLFPSIFLPPVICFALPPIISQVYSFFEYITAGNSLPALSLTFIICVVFYRAVDQFAPTREKYHLALEQCWIRLELAVLIFSTLWVRSVMAMVERLEITFPWEDLGWRSSFSSVLTRWLSMYWIDGWRMAIGAFCLSWTVGMRYFGTGGIAQCSPFLLPSNPFQEIIKSTISYLKSPDTILDSLVGPSPSQIQQNSASEQTTPRGKTDSQSSKGMRYSNPRVTTIIVQIIFHALGGYLYSISMAVSNGKKGSDQSITTTITMICCILISIATLITSYVVNTSKTLPHELSIRRKAGNDTSNKYAQIKEEFCTFFRTSKLLLICIATPIVVSLAMLAQIEKEAIGADSFLLIKDLAIVLLHSTYPKTFFLMIYTVVLDIIVKMTLVAKGVHIDRLISTKSRNRRNSNISNDKELNVEGLVVQSILAGLGTAIVEEVVAPYSPVPPHSSSPVARGMLGETMVSSAFNLEADENHRYSVTIGYVADAIETGSVSGCTSLQENLLRMLILESLGGGRESVGDSENTFTKESQQGKISIEKKEIHVSFLTEQNGVPPIGLSPHHHCSLKRLLCEPSIVPIVRSLCAYVGGLGVALKRCSVHSSSTTKTTWSFPPCASESVEYAIVAAVRLVVLTIKDRSTKNFRRDHNRVSPLILVVLKAAFDLRCGLLMYATYLIHLEGVHMQLLKEGFFELSTDAGTKNLRNHISAHYHDINRLLVSCEKAAMNMMQVSNSYNIANAGCECEAWLKSLR